MDNAFHFALICEFRGRHYLRMYSLDLKNTQLVDIAPELKNRSISDTASTLILDESYDSFVLCSNSVFQRYEHALSPSLTPSMTGTLPTMVEQRNAILFSIVASWLSVLPTIGYL